MKLKRLFLLFLAVTLCFGLAACGSEEGQDPETIRKDLASMTDEQLIPILLDNYSKGQEPAVFSGEMSWLYRSGDTVIAQMEGITRRNGVNRTLEVTYTVGEESKKEEYVYYDGICYVNAGKKQKAAKTEGEVSSFFATRYPSFGYVADYDFAKKDLLRSDNGIYTLVLSAPAGGIVDSADIIKPLTAAGNKTAPITMSGFTDIYLTLSFSADGILMGQTLGFDCQMDADGVVTEGTVLFRYSITSASAEQVQISAPQESDSYTDTTEDFFAQAENSVTTDDSDDTSSADDE